MGTSRLARVQTAGYERELSGAGKAESVKRKRKFAGSRVRKWSVRIGTHNTSLTLEEEFLRAMREIAQVRQLPLSKLFADIDKDRTHSNLSSAVRVYVLDHYRRLAEEAARSGMAKR